VVIEGLQELIIKMSNKICKCVFQIKIVLILSLKNQLLISCSFLSSSFVINSFDSHGVVHLVFLVLVGCKES